MRNADFGMSDVIHSEFETFEKSMLSPTRKKAPVVLERSEESAMHATHFFAGKSLSCSAGLSLCSKMTVAFLH